MELTRLPRWVAGEDSLDCLSGFIYSDSSRAGNNNAEVQHSLIPIVEEMWAPTLMEP